MRLRIIAYPHRGIAYTELFYEALSRRGVSVVEGVWAGRWIVSNVRAGDTVHLHWPSFLYVVQGRIRAVGFLRFCVLLLLVRMRARRLVWTAHNLYPHDSGLRIGIHRLARRIVIWLADRIVVHGAHASRIVSAEFGVRERKLCCIRHGHFQSRYPRTITQDEARRRLGIDADAFVFGFVGLCRPYKNLESLISGYETVGKGSMLLIAGHFQCASYQQRLKDRMRTLDPSMVVFHPHFLRDEELQIYVLASDVVVLPYTDILTSGSAMLALSFGRPVIAPRLGGLPELIGTSYGVLYDPREPDGLAQAMRSARERQFDEEGILAYASTFTWDNAAAHFIDLLQN